RDISFRAAPRIACEPSHLRLSVAPRRPSPSGPPGHLARLPPRNDKQARGRALGTLICEADGEARSNQRGALVLAGARAPGGTRPSVRAASRAHARFVSACIDPLQR